ncbi:MFS transporter [Stenotrophomonas sp.]|uniref:MFS transporter n=1 Tax=Stenotrophomonas sp. TaxID=69392 RepID=UPI0031D6522E
MRTATSPAQPAALPALTPALTLVMALCAGLAVANIYYNQPMLGLMQRELPGTLTGLVPTATQLGYALGLFALVPLGDRVERRRLIVVQFTLLAVALAFTALAPSGAMLLAASLLVGVTATVAQQIVPLAAALAAPERRGATIGIVMSGVLCGILLSRTLSGAVGDHAGWRAMFWLGVPLALGAAVLARTLLPVSQPTQGASYPALMRSLVGLWRELPVLRRAAITQALLFAAFAAFWTTLSLRLPQVNAHYGAQVAGLFGIVGAVGILAAPLAGRIADRRGPHLAIIAGSALTLLSWLLLGLWPSIIGLVVGCVLLDLAVQGVLVSQQHVVYALRPEARSRLNTLFMGSMFLGGAAGAAAASWAWSLDGWRGVVALSIGLAALATALQLGTRAAAR